MRDYQRKQKQCNDHKRMQHHTQTNIKKNAPRTKRTHDTITHTGTHTHTHRYGRKQKPKMSEDVRRCPKMSEDVCGACVWVRACVCVCVRVRVCVSVSLSASSLCACVCVRVCVQRPATDFLKPANHTPTLTNNSEPVRATGLNADALGMARTVQHGDSQVFGDQVDDQHQPVRDRIIPSPCAAYNTPDVPVLVAGKQDEDSAKLHPAKVAQVEAAIVPGPPYT